MNTSKNTSQNDFRTRLIAFLVVLAVGFAMGWFNGTHSSSDTSTSGIVAQQSDSRQSATETSASDDQESATSEADDTTETPAPADDTDDAGTSTVAPTRGPTAEKDGWYTSKEEVALYIHTYGRLPGNFISKTKARERGWDASSGNLDEVCPGMSIGGSRFYNDEDQLPYKRGRQWTECDINYEGGYRGAERIVFSNDGLVYYTSDHYQTFERLY